MRQIQKWQISKAGSLSRLKLVSDSLSDPGENEVQVTVKSVGLNFAGLFNHTNVAITH